MKKQLKCSVFVTGSRFIPFHEPSGIYRFSHLFNELKKSGLNLSHDPKSDWLISINHNKKEYQRFISNGGSANRAILLRDEPVSVFPMQFKNAIEKLYLLVLTPGLCKELSSQSFFIPWPYESNANPNKPEISDQFLIYENLSKNMIESMAEWNLRENYATVISANKVSSKKSIYYDLRRKIAHQSRELNVLVYGDLWNSGLLRKIRHRVAVLFFAVRNKSAFSIRSVYGNLHWRYNSHGPVENKFKTLLNSKFSIVLENSDTTISEKIFDAIIAGCVPVYFGPKLDSVGLPKDIAFECDPEINSFVNLMKDLSPQQIENVRISGQKFIRSRDFKEIWLQEKVNSYLHEVILLKMNSPKDIPC
jgi:hypothetical protein